MVVSQDTIWVYSILKTTPITLAPLANQIVNMCAWLSNFQPSLVPPPRDEENEHGDSNVKSYFNDIDDSDYDADESEDE